MVNPYTVIVRILYIIVIDLSMHAADKLKELLLGLFHTEVNIYFTLSYAIITQTKGVSWVLI